jgi:hypothetical protein
MADIIHEFFVNASPTVYGREIESLVDQGSEWRAQAQRRVPAVLRSGL